MSLPRSLFKKVRQLEKSTPPLVVAVVTNMRCGGRIRPTLEFGKTPVVQNRVVPTGSMLYHYNCCEQNSPPFWQKSLLHILARNNDLWASALPQISGASQHNYEDAVDKDCAFCLTHGVSVHSVALHDTRAALWVMCYEKNS